MKEKPKLVCVSQIKLKVKFLYASASLVMQLIGYIMKYS